MSNPLVIAAIVVCTAFFGFSWTVTIGDWLNVGVLDVEHKWGVEGLTRLAYAGTALSIIVIFGLAAEKIQKTARKQ